MIDGNAEWAELHPVINPHVQVQHFRPTENGRDRFGNRVITSPEKGYFDRQGNESRAALLISREGDQFIKMHPSILNALNDAIATFKSHASTENILIPGGKVKFIEEGGQSDIYQVILGNEQYILKVKYDYGWGYQSRYYENVSQPYINEMLQTQEIGLTLKKRLRPHHVETASFLFASSDMSLVKFEQGKSPEVAELRTIIRSIFPIIDTYITTQQKNGNPLWDNIELDFEIVDDPVFPRQDNFIKRPDGTTIMIDPFVYRIQVPMRKAVTPGCV